MKKKNKGSRLWSRILAVQAIYLMTFNRDVKEQKVIKDLLNNKEIKNIADKFFFSQLVKKTQSKEKEITKGIINLITERKFNKMETLIKVIIKLGFCEIIYFKDIPIKVSIAEYNKVGDSFLNKKEVGLINSILDKISKK